MNLLLKVTSRNIIKFIIFTLLEDRDRVMEGGPYFFNYVDLFLRNWVKRFNSDLEKLAWSPVWVCLYLLA